MIFSLIMATYGRKKEIERFFLSLLEQDFPSSQYELIIVDQNDSINLDNLVSSYHERINIVHVKSSIKGISYNRNIGLDMAKGKYVCFPDDDCTYYPDTLSSVYQHFSDKKLFAVFGAIRDRESSENIIRDWPASNKKITKKNFFLLYSSITVFVEKNNIRFDERLGAGCYFGSYEDSDYVYKLINLSNKCCYFSDVEVWHPPIGITQFERNKNYSYGLGFGAFCAKYATDIFVLRLFFLSIAYHFFFGIGSLLQADLESFQARWVAVSSRCKGFFEFLKSEN